MSDCLWQRPGPYHNKRALDKSKEEAGTPWAHWWENDLNKTPPNVRGPVASIARLLKPFGIRARAIKMPDDSTSRGYVREDFEDNWSRFCPVAPERRNHVTFTRIYL
jgi:hypothetical protein